MNIGNYVHGKISIDEKNQILDIYDPSKGEIIGGVYNSNKTNFTSIVESSKKGFTEWQKYTPLKRSRILSSSMYYGPPSAFLSFLQ